MASRFSTATIIFAISILLIGQNAPACPDCNIHNFLAVSVCSSKNIFVGKLIKGVDKSTVQVEVTRTLRGDHKVGQTLEAKVRWYEEENIGNVFIFSDPESWGANYDFLPATYLDEVQFLTQYKADEEAWEYLESLAKDNPHIKSRPVVKTLKDALLRCQDVSNESRKLSLEYIQAMKQHPADVIIDVIEKKRKQKPENSYDVGCLVVALLLKSDPRVEQYVMQQVQAFVDFAAPEPDWKNIPYGPSPHGLFLTALIGATGERWTPAFFARYACPKKKPLIALRAKERKLLLGAYPKLSVQAMAEATFALCSTEMAKPEDLLSLLGKDQDHEGFALGMFFIARKHWSGWAREEATTTFKQVLAITKHPELQKKAQEFLDLDQKLHSRPAQ